MKAKIHVKTGQDVPAQPAQMPGAQGVRVRVLLGPADGAERFFMRQFDIAPGGQTPLHEHPWEHEVYVLGGQGVVVGPEGEQALSAGMVAFVPPDEEHQFRNTGPAPWTFLCLVPPEGQQ